MGKSIPVAYLLNWNCFQNSTSFPVENLWVYEHEIHVKLLRKRNRNINRICQQVLGLVKCSLFDSLVKFHLELKSEPNAIKITSKYIKIREKVWMYLLPLHQIPLTPVGICITAVDWKGSKSITCLCALSITKARTITRLFDPVSCIIWHPYN